MHRCLVQALTRWGGALLELAHFRQGSEAYEMIQQVDAVVDAGNMPALAKQHCGTC